MVISHKEDRVVCLKATSQVDRYYSDTKLLKGALHYKVGQCPCFSRPTIVEPDNRFEIKYSDLAGQCEVIGYLPTSAKRQLIEAVNNSHTMDARQQAEFLAILA